MRHLFLAFACLLAGPAQALDLSCMGHRPLLNDRAVERPDLPYCTEAYFAFTSEWEFSSCRDEMLAYERKLRDYLRCLDSEADEAVREFNEAIDSFNRRAQL